MPIAVTFNEFLNQLLYPLFALLGITLRVVGVFCVSVVAGSLLHSVLVYKRKARFALPLIFLGVALMFGFAAVGRWSSPGTLAMFGIGLFVGYLFVDRKPSKQTRHEDDSEPINVGIGVME